MNITIEDLINIIDSQKENDIEINNVEPQEEVYTINELLDNYSLFTTRTWEEYCNGYNQTYERFLRRRVKMNSEEIEEIILEPDPARIMEGLRDTGYEFNTAMADIVDNSIAAEATIVKVKIDMKPDNSIAVYVSLKLAGTLFLKSPKCDNTNLANVVLRVPVKPYIHTANSGNFNACPVNSNNGHKYTKPSKT